MIARHEWRFAFVAATLAISLQQIPYAFGYARARPATEYQGLVLNVEDFSYHAIMAQGYAGAWQYHIRYTSEEHAPAFIYGFYLALGHLARALGISVVAMWHAALIAFALILFVALYAFIAQFIRNVRARQFAYLLAIFGAGLDWFLFPWERLDIVGVAPIDFRMPEAHLFYSAMTYPHYSAAITLILAVFWLATRALERSDFRLAFLVSLANLALAIVFPFLIYLTAGVLGVYWLYRSFHAKQIQWRAAFLLFVAFLVPVPLLLGYAYTLATNSVLRIWNAQATTVSPNPLHYLLAYGAMLALAGLGWRVPRDETNRSPLTIRHMPPVTRHTSLLWLWVLVVAILLYAPLNAQRRFVAGVQIPLAILATRGLFEIALPRIERTRAFAALAARPRYSREGVRRLLRVLFLVIISIANWVILLRLSLLTAIEQPDAFFRSRDEIAAVDWLRDNTPRDSIVLGAYWTGSFIPARAGNRVFVGQRYETVRFDEKQRASESFFDVTTSDAWRRDLLAQYHIAYVFYGARERDLGKFDPARVDYLERAYSNAQVTILRVKR